MTNHWICFFRFNCFFQTPPRCWHHSACLQVQFQSPSASDSGSAALCQVLIFNFQLSTFRMTTRQGVRYQPFQPHSSKPRKPKKADGNLMAETMSQPSFQLPNLPDDIMPFHQPFPPPPPSALIIQADEVQSPLDRKWTWVRDSLYDPRDVESVWFSCAELYAKTQASSDSDELELSQTHPIIEFWSSLRDAQFAGEMDAFLPHPNIKEEMYVFAGILTAKIDTTSSLCFSTIAPVLQY